MQPAIGRTDRRRWPRRSAKLPVAALLCALGGLGGVGEAQAEWEIEGSVAAFHDDNLTRAQDTVDHRAASAAAVNLTGTTVIPFPDSRTLTLSVYGRAETYDRYRGLDNVLGGATGVYRVKFGIGRQAPWASVVIDGAYANYRDDLRTGATLQARLEVGQRFGDAFTASAGVYWSRRYDDRGDAIVPGIAGDVFALAGHGGFVRAEYAFANGFYLDFKSSVRRGDVESTAQPSLPIFLASDAIAPDPVWGDPNLFAYRLRGTTYGNELTASYALSGQSSLNATYRYDTTRATQGLHYSSNLSVLSFAYRF